MGRRIDERELRRRAVDGVRVEVEAFGSAAPDSHLIRGDGLLAAVVPACPRRSVFNSVFYAAPAALARDYEELAEAYDAAGVSAWTVWVPDRDRAAAELLASRGHALDAAPRAMAMELAGLPPEPAPPPGVEPGPIETTIAAGLNDRAYGFGADDFRAAFAGKTAIRWFGAYADGEPVSCVGTIAIGDDACVTGVATLPGHRGRGTASWLMLRALAAAREEGALTASLRASKAGAPVYERLGFADLGFVEMWEWRR